MSSPLHRQTAKLPQELERPASERADSKGSERSSRETKKDEESAMLPAQYTIPFEEIYSLYNVRSPETHSTIVGDLRFSETSSLEYQTAAFKFFTTLGMPTTIAGPIMGLIAEYFFTPWCSYFNWALWHTTEERYALAEKQKLWQRIISISTGNECLSSDLYASLGDFYQKHKASLLPKPRKLSNDAPEIKEIPTNAFRPITDVINTHDNQYTVVYDKGRIVATHKNDGSKRLCEVAIFDHQRNYQWQPLEFCSSSEAPIIYVKVKEKNPRAIERESFLAYDIAFAPILPTQLTASDSCERDTPPIGATGDWTKQVSFEWLTNVVKISRGTSIIPEHALRSEAATKTAPHAVASSPLHSHPAPYEASQSQKGATKAKVLAKDFHLLLKQMKEMEQLGEPSNPILELSKLRTLPPTCVRK